MCFLKRQDKVTKESGTLTHVGHFDRVEGWTWILGMEMNEFEVGMEMKQI